MTICQYAAAQSYAGKVKDAENNTPIPGATVVVKGKKTGTSTNANGNFSIQAIPGDTVVISFISYLTKTIVLTNNQNIEVLLDKSPNELNAVVITGRAGAGKRSKLETSYSVTNIGYKALSLQAPTSVTESLKSVPGFWVESSGGEASGNVRARGVPVDGYGSIQLLEDGVPVQHDPALGYLNADQAFRFDETIQSVEVVRGGPASIFYSNAPAGAVNYIPRTVGNKTEGIFKLTVGSGNLFREDFWVGAPIDDWKLSVGGFYRTGDGVRSPGFSGNNGGQFRANISRRWEKSSFSIDYKKLNDNVELYLGIPMVNKNGKIVGVPGFNANYGTIAGQETEKLSLIQGDGSKYNFDNSVGTQIKRDQITAKFETELLDDWKLKNVLRYDNTFTQRNGVYPNTLQNASDYLATQSNLLATVPGAQKLGLQYVTSGDMFNTANQNGNGLMIQGGLRGLTLPLKEIDNDLHISRIFNVGSTRHDFNFGYYYSNFAEDFSRFSSIALLDVQNNARLLNLVAMDANGKVLKTFTDNGIYRDGYEWANAHGEQRTNALYLSDEWEITPALRIDGGLRWEDVQARGVVEQPKNVNLGTFATSNVQTGSGLFLGYKNRFNYTTGTLGLNYQLSDNMGAFARYTSAARIPGLGNYITNVKATPITQTMDLGEIGYKFATQKVSLYATGFYTKYNNVGFTNYVFDVNGNNTPQNLYANTKTLGLELEAGYYPVKWFDITATSTLQKGEYKGFKFTDNTGKNHDYSGNMLIRIPAVSLRTVPGFNLFADKFRIQIPIEYEGKRYVDAANSVVLPSYVKIDVNAQVNITKSLSVFGIIDNLNNSLGLTEGNPRLGEVQNNDYGASSFIARPLIGRSYKMSLRYKF